MNGLGFKCFQIGMSFHWPEDYWWAEEAGDPDAGIWDRDVPMYTQIGNAVPVRLAELVGKHAKKVP